MNLNIQQKDYVEIFWHSKGKSDILSDVSNIGDVNHDGFDNISARTYTQVMACFVQF